MRTTELFLDPSNTDLVHASLTCEHNARLLEMTETQTGTAVSDLDQLLAAVQQLGYSLPAWSARGMRYCPHCTLVATADWAVAA